MEESWKAIKNYEGLYEVSSYGSIRKVIKMTPYLKNRKPLYNYTYLTTNSRSTMLTKNGERIGHVIARLVYQAFNGKLIGGLIIDHIDNDPTNNHYSNLQQITHKENVNKDKWRYSKFNNREEYDEYKINKKRELCKRKIERLNKPYIQNINNKYTTSIWIKDKYFHIGIFNTEEEATNAYFDILENGKSFKYRKNSIHNIFTFDMTKVKNYENRQ